MTGITTMKKNDMKIYKGCKLLLVCLLFFSTAAYSQFQQGNTMVPLGASTWPIIYSNQARGGHHQVATLTDRNAIPLLRRQPGMLCTVVKDASGKPVTYQLICEDTDEDLIDNAKWKVFGAGSGTGTGPGEAGKSAFELWQELPGNAGKPIADFFLAIKGEVGPDGKSAFQIWEAVDANKGKVEADFLTALKGTNGKSAFEIWKVIVADDTKTETDYLAALKGEKGDTGEKGDAGEKGTDGIAGAKGDKGDVGEKGADGIAGAKGDKGDVGEKGADGVAGAKGDKGDVGEKGADGVAGAKGDKGDAGEKGADGIAGAKGDKGDAGEKGADGVAGAKGDKGDAGEKGADGIAGVKGDKGDVGEKGADGIAGAKGDKGDAGEKGTDGIVGPKGDKGDAGEKGADGVAGVKGDKGDVGEKGADGVAGAKGDKGDAGEKGTDGIAGVKGDKGDAGERGLDGPKGADGLAGKSAFDIWKEIAGNENKTETEFIAEMKGKDGAVLDFKGSYLNLEAYKAVAENTETLNKAYYNETDKKSYIYNGTAWKIFAQDGTGSGGSVNFNGNRPITGLPEVGMNPGTDDLGKWIEKAFYPSQGPSSSLSVSSPTGVQEIGNQNVDVTLDWSVTRAAATEAITEIIVHGQNKLTTSPPPGGFVNGSITVSVPGNVTASFNMSVKTADNKTDIKSASVAFQWRSYWGFIGGSADGADLRPTDAQIYSGLTGGNSALGTSFGTVDRNATPNGSMKLVIAYPSSWAGSAVWVGPLDSTGAFTKEVRSFTNAKGASTSYVIYVQKDNTDGTLSFNIK